MSPRETIREKSLRYIAAGHLQIELVSQGRVVATCRGDRGDLYSIDYDPRRQKWTCTCPSRKRCCHVTAAVLVTATAEAA
jgi:uncharacterized Zn finger protein